MMHESIQEPWRKLCERVAQLEHDSANYWELRNHVSDLLADLDNALVTSNAPFFRIDGKPVAWPALHQHFLKLLELTGKP